MAGAVLAGAGAIVRGPSTFGALAGAAPSLGALVCGAGRRGGEVSGIGARESDSVARMSAAGTAWCVNGWWLARCRTCDFVAVANVALQCLCAATRCGCPLALLQYGAEFLRYVDTLRYIDFYGSRVTDTTVL